MTSLIVAGSLIAAYLLGSVPFGLLIGKRRGVDVRVHGSGNIGATNVARNLGKRTGALVLLLDAWKGALPTLFLRYLVYEGVMPISLMAGVGLAAIIGHCFSLFLRFRGGKGVATSLGVFLVLDPLVCGLCVLVFVAVYAAFKLASLASVCAALAFPVLLHLLGRPLPLTQMAIGVAALIVFKHRSNIARVFSGDEHRV